jgi:membrane protease subunit HflC
MNSKLNGVLVVLVLGLIIVSMSVFIVDEREHVLKFQFGEIVRSDYEPGLHFKWPVVQNVAKYPNRILTDDDPTQEKFLTGEKKNLIVDYFVTWRIREPEQYYRAVNGDERRATERLSAVVKEGIKAAISRRTVQEVVAAERSELMDQMLIDVRSRSPELGIEVIDVRVMRIDLSSEVSDSVFNRMREERRRTAADLRAQGEEEAERIRADADRQATVIRAEARRESELIRGDGDATAADTYARAFSQDPDFYGFYRSMSAYRNSIGGDRDVLILQPDSEFFRYLQSQFGTQVLSE